MIPVFRATQTCALFGKARAQRPKEKNALFAPFTDCLICVPTTTTAPCAARIAASWRRIWSIRSINRDYCNPGGQGEGTGPRRVHTSHTSSAQICPRVRIHVTAIFIRIVRVFTLTSFNEQTWVLPLSHAKQLCEYKKRVKLLSQFKEGKVTHWRISNEDIKGCTSLLETLLKQTKTKKKKQRALDVTHEPPRSSCLLGKCARAVCVNAAAR